MNSACKNFLHNDLNNIYISGGKLEDDREPNPDAYNARQIRQDINKRAWEEINSIAVIYEEEIA